MNYNDFETFSEQIVMQFQLLCLVVSFLCVGEHFRLN